MKAEREDAPWSARQRRKDSTGVLLISLTAGCLTLGGALLYHHEHLPASSPPLPVPASALHSTLAPTSPALLPPPVTQQRPMQAITSSGARQSTFNEHNYRPRTDINVIQSVQPGTAKHQVAQASQAKRQFKWRRWNWSFAGKHHSMKIHWQELNGRIEWRTVCHNLKAGSLDYRTCRKEAKALFKQMCREQSRSPACAAAHFYNPITG